MRIAELWNTYLEFESTHPRVFIHFSLALFFATLALLFAASIVFTKVVKAFEQIRRSSIEKKFDNLISEVILSPEASESSAFSDRHLFLISAYQKKYMRSRFARNLMLERMLELKRSIEGTLELRIIELYRSLGLQADSIRKVKSRRWFLVVKGMKEIAEMQVREANYLLIDKLNSSNQHVKREAQIALVKLSPENPLYFLDNPKIYLTMWQKLRIHRFIRKNAKSRLPSFEKWLESSSESVLRFSIRMIGLFQQLSAAEKVASFLNHQNLGVRNAAFNTLMELEAYHLVPNMYGVLKNHPEFLNPVSLRTMSKLAMGDEAVELALPLLTSEDYFLKKEAIEVLLKANFPSGELIEKAGESQAEAIRKIMLHLQDPLLA